MRPLRRPGISTPPELLFFEELRECLKDVAIRDDEAAFARQFDGAGITRAVCFQAGHLDPAAVAA